MQYAPEVQSIVNASNLTRYGDSTGNLKPPSRLNGIAKRGLADTAQRQVGYSRAIWKIAGELIPDFPSFNSVRSETKAIEDHQCGPACNHEEPKQKDFTPSEMADIEAEFRRIYGDGAAFLIDQQAEEAIRDIAGNGVSNYNDLSKNPIFIAMLLKGIKEAARIALYKSDSAWKRLGRTAPLPGGPIPLAGEPWILELEANGLALIRDKYMKLFSTEIKQIMVQGFNRNLSAEQVASALNRRAGTGALWQFRRLVRTEMTGAITETARRQYEANGVTYMQYSVAGNACPICLELAMKDTGYGQGLYLVNEFPAIPSVSHPNCRCCGYPVYRRTGES